MLAIAATGHPPRTKNPGGLSGYKLDLKKETGFFSPFPNKIKYTFRESGLYLVIMP